MTTTCYLCAADLPDEPDYPSVIVLQYQNADVQGPEVCQVCRDTLVKNVQRPRLAADLRALDARLQARGVPLRLAVRAMVVSTYKGKVAV